MRRTKRLCEFRVGRWTCLEFGLHPKPNLFRPNRRGLYLNSEYMRTSPLWILSSEFRWSIAITKFFFFNPLGILLFKAKLSWFSTCLKSDIFLRWYLILFPQVAVFNSLDVFSIVSCLLAALTNTLNKFWGFPAPVEFMEICLVRQFTTSVKVSSWVKTAECGHPQALDFKSRERMTSLSSWFSKVLNRFEINISFNYLTPDYCLEF